MMRLFLLTSLSLCCGALLAADPKPIPSYQLLPLPDHQVSIQINGVEKTRWHFDEKYPRPFFYPFNGPSGTSLTRMGHPGAANHDHHRSVWFAHADVDGENFWADGQSTQLRQKHWLAFNESDDEAIMAVLLEWAGDFGESLMDQELIVAMRELDGGETLLEIQMTLSALPIREDVELGKTNFGPLAVRVSKTISDYFGGGTITSSEGAVGEPDIFGKPARWMDYSGPVAVGEGPDRKTVTEGITYFVHPENPRYPFSWHVREDGWMGASFCMHEPYTITKEEPLVLRFMLHAHAGAYDAKKAEAQHDAFASRPGFELGKPEKHGSFEVHRIDDKK